MENSPYLNLLIHAIMAMETGTVAEGGMPAPLQEGMSPEDLAMLI